MDRYTREKRSKIMSRVRARDTRPEKVLRSALHGLGYRFRLHDGGLPGKPDLVLPKFRTAIFVNGCFWHQHRRCLKAKTPESNRDFWKKKLERNVERDRENMAALKRAGWQPVVVWECDLSNATRLRDVIEKLDTLFRAMEIK